MNQTNATETSFALNAQRLDAITTAVSRCIQVSNAEVARTEGENIMNTEPTPPPEVLGSPSGSAACPEWKTPKHLADQQEQAKVRAMTVEEALPSSVHRIGWLKDRDAQLRQLLDYLQSLGIPMGSETWALRTLLKIRRLEAESDAARRVLRSLNDKELPNLERMRLDFDHARAMHAKHLPPMETRCDWCGWPGARLIGGGNAACEDCLPNVNMEAPNA